MLFALLLACSPEPAPAPTGPAPNVVATAAPAGVQPHGHGPKHGGKQVELDGLHVEALAMAQGVMIWTTDSDDKALALGAVTGTATVAGPTGVAEFPLTPMGDHLHAASPLVQGQPATVVVTLTYAGKSQSATFEFASVGLEEHDHTSLHGGQVSMWGDTHVEYLSKDGEHRFWISDAAREAIGVGVSGSVTDAGKTVPLVLDATGMLSAKAEGTGTRTVTGDFIVGGTPFTLGFSTEGPTGDQAHGEHGHGHGAGEKGHAH